MGNSTAQPTSIRHGDAQHATGEQRTLTLPAVLAAVVIVQAAIVAIFLLTAPEGGAVL